MAMSHNRTAFGANSVSKAERTSRIISAGRARGLLLGTRTWLREALDFRIADFKGCVMLPFLLFSSINFPKLFCPAPGRRPARAPGRLTPGGPEPGCNRVFQLLQRTLKMCSDGRALKLAMQHSKSAFHAVQIMNRPAPGISSFIPAGAS